MGNSQAHSASPRFAMASRAFSKQELDDLKSLFDSLAAKSQSNAEFISLPVFQDYFAIKGPLAGRMFNLITQNRNDSKLAYDDLVIAKGTYEKGAPNEIEEFIYQLCDINGDGIVGSSESIPNGVGFGGRATHFGLFLSASFDQGHTFECTTFNSPCLSRTSRIRPEVIECWGVQLKGAEKDKKDSVKGSVLERFKEDRNMLKMVGLANSSE